MLAALQKHGGVKRVAEQLRWSRNRTRARRRVGADGGEAVGKRVKVLRRPVAYWNDVERVKVEIGAFVDEFGTRGCMPTQKQFQMVGRSDLLNAAGRHGGLVVIAKMMGFRTRKKPRPRNHWNDLETVKKALVDFANTYTDGKMPTGDELVARGESGLANAVPVHGGFPKVAEICGLQRRSVGSGAPVVWDEVRLRREIIGFLVAHVPRKARERVMPSERELRKFGRNDLSYAVQKFGGFKKVAVVCGLQSKKKGPFVGKTEETSGDA